MPKAKPPIVDARVERLRACIDRYAGRFKELRDARTVEEYVARTGDRSDEELLTEPLLAAILEDVLGFPADAYFPQFGRSGLKPDFTPIDLIAHSFVLDAKGSGEQLRAHEAQIRRYVDQRALQHGVLFNLREVRVFRRGEKGHDSDLSFQVLPLWKLARGEAMAGPELDRFLAFCDRFSYREMGFDAKIGFIRTQEPWSQRLAREPDVSVDVEFLVQKLRILSRLLAEDAATHVEHLERVIQFAPARETKLVDELELLVLDLAPGTDLASLPDSLASWRAADGLPARAWRQYLVRVAYLSLVRMLLYRSWEDVEFVDDYLYDGGFDRAYDRLSGSVRKVLEEAFKHGRDRYQWLFGTDNNYDWYRPGEASLVDVLYALAPVPLGRLDADVLGSLYESYAEDIDRDRLGQFFTPRSVVRFMLDRVGFDGPAGVFRLEGDVRRPRRVLDFATGSGGFLVEAARRVIDEGGLDLDERRDIDEGLAAIVQGFVGGEISPFPYYLTEVNLLLQASRLLGRLSLLGDDAPAFVLGTLHVDTLTAKSGPNQSIEELDASLRADRRELVEDEYFDLVPLTGEKRERFRELHTDGTFDLVVGNPPYVAEANNKILFDRLRSIPGWKPIYRGKTDYLYYFLWLAVEKLAPGGRLCVITPAGWMNAGAADFLREKLASELRLDELFLFGSYKLFAPEHDGKVPTPTVESAILIATKTAAAKSHKLRVVALEDETKAPTDRAELLAEMARRAKGRKGRRGGIHAHSVAQSELRADRPWAVKWSAQDAAARAVAHLEGRLVEEAPPVEPLAVSWKVFQGIQTGADAYSRRVLKRLSSQARARLEADGAREGDPIMELPAGCELEEPWRSYPELLCRNPEPTAILYAALDENDRTNLLRLTKGSSPPAAVIAALDHWRPVLANRAEILRNAKRSWWETAWPRDAHDLASPKVIALYRTDRGRFALDETGDWQPSIKTTLVVGRTGGSPVAYLCGLLNSELLDLWYAVRGKTPWHVRRNYEPLRMNEIPYRRPEGDQRANEIADLVRQIAANRRALLPHREVFSELGRVVKDPWKTGPVAIDRAALAGTLPAAEMISIRLDPALSLAVSSTPVGKPRRDDATTIGFMRAKKVTATLTGPAERLDLVEEFLAGKPADDLPALLLPRDLSRFEQLALARSAEVQALLDEGRRLVEEVERLVCALYDVPDDLAEEVVQHAVRRANASA